MRSVVHREWFAVGLPTARSGGAGRDRGAVHVRRIDLTRRFMACRATCSKNHRRNPLRFVAAHAAGYADSAHLSRQFEALFGFSPSDALARVERAEVTR